MKKALNAAYAIQRSPAALAESSGTAIHVRCVLEGMQRVADGVTLLALDGRSVVSLDELCTVGTGKVSRKTAVPRRFSGRSDFKLVERVTRRCQSEFRLPFFALWDTLRMCDGLGTAVRVGRIDILQAHFDLVPLAGALVSRRLRIPLVLDCEADWFEERRFLDLPLNGLVSAWASAAQRFALRSASAVVTVSAQLRDHLARRWAVPASKLHVLPNCVDTGSFRVSSADERAEARAARGLNGCQTVLFVGGFYDWHALDMLVDSFVGVVSRVPAARLLLVGDGPTSRQVQQRVRDLGIERAVSWFGAVEHSEVPTFLSLADVVVSPNREFVLDGGGTAFRLSPLKLYEYMAAGKAIVATDAGQVGEVIVHGRTGLLVSPNDTEGFARCVVSLLADTAERERLGRNARRLAERDYSFDSYGRRLTNVYGAALGTQ